MQKPTIRTVLVATFFTYLFGCSYAKGQTPPSPSRDLAISVRISTEKQTFRPGESVTLHVEIWNDGSRDVFILKELKGPDNALSTLEFRLYDEKGQVFDKGWYSAFDCFCSNLADSPAPPAMTKVLLENWTLLAPQHSYGGKVTMSAWDYKRLSTPGKYRIQGEYESFGFLAQNINNPLMGYAEELKKLPYESWSGKVATNSVWIEVGNPPSKTR